MEILKLAQFARTELFGTTELPQPPIPSNAHITNKYKKGQTQTEIVYNTIKYILDPCKTSNFMHGGNVFGASGNLTEETYQFITLQFMKVKEYYDKLNILPIKHITITFLPEYNINDNDAFFIMQELITSKNIGQCLQKHQYIYAIHDKQKLDPDPQKPYDKSIRYAKPHIHLAINTTNFYTGKTLDINPSTRKIWDSEILKLSHLQEAIMQPLQKAYGNEYLQKHSVKFEKR